MNDETPKRDACCPPAEVKVTPTVSEPITLIGLMLPVSTMKQLGEEAELANVFAPDFIRAKLAAPAVPRLRFALEAAQNPSRN